MVQERVREVLAVLSEGSRGTQACINAAQTVSGIIGDLGITIKFMWKTNILSIFTDTTIMFATSGSLNPPHQKAMPSQFAITAGEFGDHRDVIIKTAKVKFSLKL